MCAKPVTVPDARPSVGVWRHVSRALERERRRVAAERDAAILAAAGPDPDDALGPRIGLLLDDQERVLSEAIRNAFDLD